MRTATLKTCYIILFHLYTRRINTIPSIQYILSQAQINRLWILYDDSGGSIIVM